MKPRTKKNITFHLLHKGTAILLAFLVAFSPLFPLISPASPLTADIRQVAALTTGVLHRTSKGTGLGGRVVLVSQQIASILNKYTNNGQKNKAQTPSVYAQELDNILANVEPSSTGGQLLVKVGNSANEQSFEEGDIVHAFNRKRILSTHAQVIANPRNFSFNQHGLRQPGTLLDIYLQHAKEFRYERLSESKIKRIVLSTGEETIISNEPNADGEHMDVSLYLQRRLQHPTHLIFGTPGAEYWYGGSENISQDNLDAIWDAIEDATDYDRSQFTTYPVATTGHEDYRLIPVADFSDEQAGKLTRNREDSDSKRHYQLNLETLRSANPDKSAPVEEVVEEAPEETQDEATSDQLTRTSPSRVITLLDQAIQHLLSTPFARAAGTVTTSIGTNDRAIDITAVSGAGPYTVTLADTSSAKIGDALWDEHATPRKYLITAISGNDLTVRDTEAAGSAPDASATSPAQIKRYYATITLWEADLDDIGVYASGDSAVGEMYNDSSFTGSDDTVTINGGGTVGLTAITLKAAAGQGHDGTAGTGVRVLVDNSTETAMINHSVAIPVVIDQIEWDINGLNRRGGWSGVSPGMSVRRVLIHGNESGRVQWFHDADVTLLNSIIYDNQTSDAGSFGTLVRLSSVYNTTIHNFRTTNATADMSAVLVGGHPGSLTNMIVTDVTTTGTGSATCFDGSTAQSYNASSDATAAGTGSLTNIVTADQYVSIVEGSEDLHLKPGSDAINAGTDLGTSPTGVNIDIDGRNRDTEGDIWDIGAHEFIGGEYVWDGGGDGVSWADASNWNFDFGYPDDAGDTATINTGSASIAMPAGGTTIGSLTLGASYSGTLTMEDNLTVDDSADRDGNVTIIEGTLQTDKDETSNLTVDGTLHVQDGGELIVRRSSTTSEGAGQTITAGQITIDSGGSMHADGEGFAPGQGPGALGAHGGQNGDNYGTTYGSISNPTSLGSGGNGSIIGSDGGGAIAISSGGTVTVNGTLSADGNDITHEPGAGGSINITANTLAGSGTIRANGGTSSLSGRGDGGGGRISLNGVTTDSFTGTLQANGGGSGGGGGTDERGFAGTIYLNSAKRSSWTISNGQTYRLGSDGTNDYTFGAITIESGGTLEIDGNPGMNAGNGGAATLNVTTLDVQSGGTLSADDLGFDDGGLDGPGDGTSNIGGTYGGEGGDNTDATYGSLTNPINLGSGGLGQSTSAGGGGAIVINASGAVAIGGTISANGRNERDAGSGGSVNITADSMSGSGTVRANGGSSSTSNRGSGGGGRVAVTLLSGTSFGSVSFSAYGGTSTAGSIAGAAGTVYLQDANDNTSDGELIIDNNTVSTAAGTDTLISSSVTDTSVGDVTIRNAGKLQMAADTNLTISGNWTNSAGTALTAGTVTLDKSSGTQTINSDDTAFYNLTHSGAGTAQLSSSAATVSNNFTNSAGPFDLNGQNFTVSGTVSNTSTVLLEGSETVSWANDTDSGTVKYDGATDQTSLAAGDNYHHLELNDGLVGYWKFDESSAGTFADSAGNGNTGTGLGTGGTNNTPQPSSNIASGFDFANSRSLDFDGTDDIVTFTPSGVASSDKGTISAWVYPRAVGQYNGVIGLDTANPQNGRPSLLMGGGTGRPWAYIWDGISTEFNAATGLLPVLNEWQFVAVVVDGANGAKMYQWAQSIGLRTYTTATAKKVQTFNQRWNIGADAQSAVGNARALNGQVDDIRIYNRALSATEISDLAAGNHPNEVNFTLDTTLDVNGNLTIRSGDLNAAGHNVTIGGNWTNYGSYTSGSNSTTFDAVSGTQTLITDGTDTFSDFNNLQKSGGGTLQISSTPVDVDDTLTIDNSTTIDLNGQNLTATTLANNGTLQLEGGETVSITTKDTDSGIVRYDGTGSYLTALAYGNNYYDLTFAGSGGVWEPDGAVTVNNNLTLSSGTFDIDGQDLTVAGTFSNNATLRLLGTETVTLTNDTDSGTIDYDGSGTITGLATGSSYNNLLFSGNGTFDPNTDLVIGGDLVNAAATLTNLLARTFTLNGDDQAFTLGTTSTNLGTLAVAGTPGTITLGSNVTISTLLSVATSKTLQLVNYVVTLLSDLTNSGTINEDSGHVAGTSSSFYIADSNFDLDPAISLGTDKIYISLTDQDGNLNGGSVDTISNAVTITCPNGADTDSETVSLTETGNATEVFRYATGLTSTLYNGAVTQNDGTLECTDGDTITATYTDPQDGDDTQQDTSTATTDTLPTAPTSLAGTADSQTAITWSWTDNASDETGFKLFDAANDTLVATIAITNTTSYQETGLTAGQTYQRYVVAYNAAGNSSASSTVSVTTSAAPAAPSNFAGTANSASTITWSWTDNASDETGFKLLDASNTVITTIATANTTSYQETNLVPGTSYTRKIVAYNGFGDSPATSTATVSTDPATAPNTFSLLSPSSGSLLSDSTPTLSWQKATDDQDDIANYAVTLVTPGGTRTFTVPKDSATASHPVSRTHFADAFTVNYFHENDGNPSNDTISFTPNASGANFLPLESGEYGWSVTATDATGLTRPTASRSFIIDTTPATIISVSPTGTTTNPPTSFTVRTSDNHGLKQLVVTLQQQNQLFGLTTSYIDLATTTLTSLDSPTTHTFTYTPHVALQSGHTYRLELTLQDAAGNLTDDTTILQILTADQATRQQAAEEVAKLDPATAPTEEIITKLRNLLPDNPLNIEQFKTAALTRRHKQADQLQQFNQAIAMQLLNGQGVVERHLVALGVTVKRLTITASHNARQALRTATDVATLTFHRLATTLIGTNRFVQSLDNHIRKMGLFFTSSQQRLTQLWQQGRDVRVKTGLQNRQAVNQFLSATLEPALKVGRKVQHLARYNYEILTDREPTTITNVRVTQLEPTTAIVAWQTNHLTRTAKVNYGTDPSQPYTQEVISHQLTDNHQLKLTDLKANTTYYFEIMNQNGDYVFDAYYTLTTPAAGDTHSNGPLVPQVATINHSQPVTIYSQPATDSPPLDTAQPGTSHRALQEVAGWTSILLPNGQEGWVEAQFITLTPQTGPSAAAQKSTF